MSIAEEVIVKRIHVSGLTPAINPSDLSQRLGSFGTVKALDGFGSLDALGQPRKFGYVTLETTKSKLARCTIFRHPYRKRLADRRSRHESAERCNMEGS